MTTIIVILHFSCNNNAWRLWLYGICYKCTCVKVGYVLLRPRRSINNLQWREAVWMLIIVTNHKDRLMETGGCCDQTLQQWSMNNHCVIKIDSNDHSLHPNATNLLHWRQSESHTGNKNRHSLKHRQIIACRAGEPLMEILHTLASITPTQKHALPPWPT